MVCSLFAEKVESVEEIKITQESNVLIYTNLFWAPCKEAKMLLQSRGIDYSTKLVTFSKKKRFWDLKLTFFLIYECFLTHQKKNFSGILMLG